MKTALTRPTAGFLSLVASAASALGATLVTLDFSELPAQPVNGLTLGNITFGFEVGGAASDDATYNVDTGVGSTTYTTDPVLEGDATGILSFEFQYPTPELSFGLILNAGVDYTPGAVVNLYDAGSLLVDSISLNTVANSAFGISEGFLSWSDPLNPVKRAEVDFEDGAGRFGIDNLSFIPEPTPLVGSLALAGFALASLLRRRKA